MNRNPFLLLLLVALFGLNLSALAQTTTYYYVRPSGDDSNNGTSWGQAYKTLQKALDKARVMGPLDNAQIWVATGTYYPDEGIGQTNNASDGGVYSLSLTGPTGNTTSNSFTLTVNPLPVVTLTIPVGTTAQGLSGIVLITLPTNGFPTTFQASGGNSYERLIILDRVNGFEIRQMDSNTTGIFTINRMGLFTLTVTGVGDCSRTVQWVVQTQ